LQVLATGLQLLGIGDNYKPIIIGAVIILAVIVDTYRERLLRRIR
jgi:ribose transport system permease protein